MKKLTLDLVKEQDGYRVLVECGDKCNYYYPRSEDSAFHIYKVVENIIAVAEIPITAEVSLGVSQNNGEPVLLIDFDNGELQTIHGKDADEAAIAFLSAVIDWAQAEQNEQ